VAKKCGAKTRQGGKCKNPAGFKTDHPGSGKCAHHGGATPSGRIAAARETAQRLGLELQMEPHDALLLTVRRAAAWEAYCAAEVAKLTDDQVVIQHEKTRTEHAPRVEWDDEEDEVARHGVVVTTTTERSTEAKLHLWLREHQRALDQLSRLAKTAIDAGVDERRVRILEQNAGELAQWLGGLLTDLGVKSDVRTPAIVRRHLALLEGGRAA